MLLCDPDVSVRFESGCCDSGFADNVARETFTIKWPKVLVSSAIALSRSHVSLIALIQDFWSCFFIMLAMLVEQLWFTTRLYLLDILWSLCDYTTENVCQLSGGRFLQHLFQHFGCKVG